MAMELLLGQMEINILANIKTTNKMEMELLFGPKVKNMLVSSKIIRNTDWANIYTQTKKNM